MTWKTTFYLSLIAATITATILVVQYILANLWIVIAILSPFVATGLWVLYNFALVVREKRLLIQAERKQKEVVLHTDGYGMTHLIDFASRHSQNLTLDARAYRNGHFEIPHPTEQRNLELILGSRFAGSAKAVLQQQQIPQLPVPQIDLLPLLDKAERVLIKGASDAGKTTLLQHVVSRSIGVMIIDPHFAPGVWPIANNRIIGAGRNYIAINEFLNQLMTELDNRYQQRARGKTDFAPITLIIDEYQSVRAECPDAGKILSTLIRESRKVGFRLFIGSHSELVKPLGLEGQGDIRDGLLIVRLEIDQTSKQRRITIDRGNGEQECWFPPFNTSEPAALPDLVLQPTKEEEHLIGLIQAGITSRKQLSESVWGKGRYGKFYNDKIETILVKYGLEVELG